MIPIVLVSELVRRKIGRLLYDHTGTGRQMMIDRLPVAIRRQTVHMLLGHSIHPIILGRFFEIARRVSL
jgi:hypothetical protein